ncbi:MAG: 2-C-methyl-D-erythritol 4-phosphate cytidylyltransferase [Candidatus Marinimicrobia bacterium]|nr:2-C-methyl-D-erythritol 4-phosphate cytidylyltransferase [Candidatus Neomarinimicrobiota bacterium]MBL7060054.1 2-C-methyl-D-erythritol 4-phosphate cytidylyltransferase [Candidatus Neomarinimicrobiota bacterium]
MLNTQSNVGVVLPAAGAGIRFGEKKQFRVLGRRPLFYHALQPFLAIDAVREIVVVTPKDVVRQVDRELRSLSATKPIQVIAGGKRRQDSVFAGVQALSDTYDLICIHDAVRPFLSQEEVIKTIRACEENDGAILAIPAKDTIKHIQGQKILKTISRETVWLAQTPQTFWTKPLQKALNSAINDNVTGTDESMLLERLGYQIVTVEGSAMNIKITTPEDWVFAEAIWSHRNTVTENEILGGAK